MIAVEDRVLAEAIPQLIWVTDAEGTVIYVNRRYAEYTGYAPEELYGATEWRKALHPDDLERCVRDWGHAMTTGTSFETEYRLRRASDATWRWHLTRAAPIRDKHGLVTNWVGTCTDIEDQKRLESSLRASEERILDENRRKDEFLAMLGHELRNPLAPLLGAVSLLKEREHGPAEPHLDIIDRQARHMARLVDDLLDVGRISHGRIQLRKERVEIAALVERAVETALPIIEQFHHRLTVDVVRDGSAVIADPLRLAQVIANLLNNAAKYTPPGGKIHVRASRYGATVVIAVRDTGVGISREHLPHIFDLFVQGQRTLDRSQGGLGIGLTLVRRLVELHGGNAAAFSDGPGRGSEFVITLPAATSASDDALAAAPVPIVAATPARRLLVVDDHADIVNVLKEYLTWKGFDVYVAFDGREALDVAFATTPEIVLLDIGLPELDGYEVARRLRARGQFEATRLIALTGYGQVADIDRARRAGFDEHLVKPIDFARLLAALDYGVPSSAAHESRSARCLAAR